MKNLLPVASLAILAALGCSSHPHYGPTAKAILASTSGSTATGTVTFTTLADNSVEVKADLQGVPAGTHGFHIHEKGDCGDNAKNAGGHFNPGNAQHGAPDAASHHAGDFGNVTADASGNVHTTFTTRAISIAGDTTGVVTRAVVLHEKADDLASQPAGNAGSRIACGVIALTSDGRMTGLIQDRPMERPGTAQPAH